MQSAKANVKYSMSQWKVDIFLNLFLNGYSFMIPCLQEKKPPTYSWQLQKGVCEAEQTFELEIVLGKWISGQKAWFLKMHSNV